ncbi:DUF7502 family protein [Halorientalis marina]|uniref:DUF7502 family protein n=1 Tax=Halorientalis marina TaxID=2931976 RepID=UPI001FF1F032|nr:hypothetical protein [Halorientalis marina]
MTDDTDDIGRVEAAVREIRREGYKAAALHATVDGVAAFLLVELAGIVAPVEPPAVGPVTVATVAAAVVGLAVVVGEFWTRTRFYTVERFEADNPAVAGALRTARDAAEAGNESPMARRLYEDVTDRLSETSSLGFVQIPWLAVSVVLVFAVGFAVVNAAAVGFVIGGVGENATDDGSTPFGGDPNAGENDTTELQDGSDVLGRVKPVNSGEKEIGANVSGASGGDQGDDTDNDYANRGLPEDADGIGAERAGFSEGDEVDDADLIREYNLRLQARDDDE